MAKTFAKLTRPAIRNLEIGKRIAEHGIVAERTSAGDVRYSINIMADGQRIHRVIGRESEGVTRKQAEDAIEALRTRAREDRLDLAPKRKTHRTFSEAATEYLTTLEATTGPQDKGFADIANKRRNLNQHLVPALGAHRLDKLTDFAVKGYAKKRVADGASPSTVNRELSTLSHLFRRAVKWKWLKAEDCPTIEKSAEAQKQITILSPEQQQDLLRAAITDQDPQGWLFVAIGLNAAMRHSEILRIRLDQIDFANRRIYVPLAKAGQRIQPITPSLADMLAKERDQREDQSGWLFPATKSNSTTPHRQAMTKQFLRIVKRAGMDPAKVTPHVMRHTAITRLVQAKADLPTIQKISGHKTLSALMRYVHIAGAHIDEAIAAIDIGLPEPITQELHTAPKPADRKAA
ncbi:tyrosine-type recombinase/integrase [Sphingorhabdus buctiana]|uniref:Tyrosine-type recombinase/integrase n=1 Tax=Sphingorhabdus buctiana TaxID=1508805 RepID=A0ABW4MGF2_9SPHN